MNKKLLICMMAMSLMIPSMPVMASEMEPTVAPVEIEEAEETLESSETDEEASATSSSESGEMTAIEDEILGTNVIDGDYLVDHTVVMSEDWVVNGDLTVNAIILMNGYKLTVNGKMILNNGASISGQGYGPITVKEDLIIHGGDLSIGNGARVDVGNDFLVCALDEGGNYIKGNGYFSMGSWGNESTQLTVGGDFYVNSSQMSTMLKNSYGSILVAGDFTWITESSMDLGAVKLVLNGTKPQKVTLNRYLDDAYSNAYYNKISCLEIKNPNVTISGGLDNTNIQSNATIKVGEEGLIIRNMNLQGNSLTIYGDVVVAGNMDVEMASSHLTVTGDYTQTAGILKVGNGTVDIGGHLNLQGRDGFGNACLGSGSISMTETGGNLNIAKNLVLQTSTCGTYKYGILTLKGDLIQLADKVNIVAEDGHRVILPGERAQKVKFLNSANTFNILEVKKPLKEYSFSPAKCWKTLTGVVEWPFTDMAVKEGYWKYESVKYVFENNIMNGVGDGKKFNPDGTMTRAMFATVIYRMAGNPQVNYEPIFTDVPAGKWYSDAIVWAYRRGIVNGYPDGRFGHGDSITREQMAKMLKGYADVQNYYTYERGTLTTFTDAKKVSGWANEYMQWAVGSGMISGKENAGKKYLDPAGNATRAECATMLKRFIEKFQ